MKKLLLVLLTLFCFVSIVSAQTFHPINSDKSIEVNLIHPSEQDIKLIVGNSTNYEIKWIDENNYNLIWEENGVIQTLATFGALTIPSDATYISTTSGCEVWYSPQESYNWANNLSNQSNYQYYVSSATGSGWHGIHNQKDPADLCSYWLYDMPDSCSIKSSWETQCLNKTSSYCNSKDGYGPWQIMCPNISTLSKYNSRKYYDFSKNWLDYCYVYSMSNQDEYLGQCSSSCYFGICDGGNECTGVNCGSNAYCSSGNCYCNSGYGNCNGNFSDGCEANFNSDNYNCGYCGHVCGANQQCISGSCVTQDPCYDVTCSNYCSGENRFFNGYCSNGNCIGYNSENCNNYDGYTCNGNTKEYRDYYCAPNSCNYSVSSSINCDSLDNYSSWEYYCSGNNRRQHRKFYDYSCSSNDCALISSSYTDDSLTETCQLECLGSPPNAYCNNGCSGQLNVLVQDKQGTLLQNAEVFVNNTLKGTTDSQGKFSVPTLSSSCNEVFSVKVVSVKGTDCGTKTTIINENSDQDFIYFACYDPLPQIELDAVPGTFTYVLNEIINFSVTAFDEFSEMLSDVGIGVIDPLQNVSFFNVIPVFPWNYSTTATQTGSKEFKFSAFKTGFEPDYKKVNLMVESLPSIKVLVQDSQENSIENAKVFLDNELIGTTNSNGTKNIPDVSKGPHAIEVQCANNKTCGTKSVVAVSGENPANFTCNCGGDLVVQVFSPDESPISNVYVQLDDMPAQLTNASGAFYFKNLSHRTYDVKIFLSIKETPDQNFNSFETNAQVTVDSDYQLHEFVLTTTSFNSLELDENKQVLILNKAFSSQDMNFSEIAKVIKGKLTFGLEEPLIQENTQDTCRIQYVTTGIWPTECETQTTWIGEESLTTTTDSQPTPFNCNYSKCIEDTSMIISSYIYDPIWTKFSDGLNQYTRTTYTEKGAPKSKFFEECLEQQGITSKITRHINNIIYDEWGNELYNQHIGNYKENGQECTVYYEPHTRACKKSCEKSPKDYIRNPPTYYPCLIPDRILDETIRYNNVENGWPYLEQHNPFTDVGTITTVAVTGFLLWEATKPIRCLISLPFIPATGGGSLIVCAI